MSEKTYKEVISYMGEEIELPLTYLSKIKKFNDAINERDREKLNQEYYEIKNFIATLLEENRISRLETFSNNLMIQMYKRSMKDLRDKFVTLTNSLVKISSVNYAVKSHILHFKEQIFQLNEKNKAREEERRLNKTTLKLLKVYKEMIRKEKWEVEQEAILNKSLEIVSRQNTEPVSNNLITLIDKYSIDEINQFKQELNEMIQSGKNPKEYEVKSSIWNDNEFLNLIKEIA